MKRALSLTLLASTTLLGCPTESTPPDASVALDAASADVSEVDAFAPPRDWPFAEPPRSSEPEPGITRDVIEEKLLLLGLA